MKTLTENLGRKPNGTAAEPWRKSHTEVLSAAEVDS